jgi:tRNA modification GTPase
MPLPDARDTICALSTARGRAGIAVVRLSGPDALALGWPRFRPRRLVGQPPPRQMIFGDFLDADGEPLDEALLVYFPPASAYTGEPLIEFHLHGSPVVVEAALTALTKAGARPARPGEFTQRAFLAGRLDLTQAEAVAELIEARSVAAARAAQRRLTGALSDKVAALRDLLANALALTEAEIDFPGEDIGKIDARELSSLLEQARAGVASLLAGHARARALAQGAVVAIAGRPNAGKSSLLNQLAGARRAIVHETAGTTRDLLEAEITLDGLPVRLVDTAGLRRATGEVERQGVELAEQVLATADLIVYLIDGMVGATAADRKWLAGLPRVPLVAWNKVDLAAPDASFADFNGPTISAKHGTNLDDLRRRIVEALLPADASGEALLAAVRHRQLAERADAHLAAAQRLIHAGAELRAIELRDAADALGEIVGATTTEHVLDAIFARFCVGK